MFAAEAFVTLLNVVLRARQAPQSLAVVLKGNPEYLDDPALSRLADQALREAVRRLAARDVTPPVS